MRSRMTVLSILDIQLKDENGCMLRTIEQPVTKDEHVISNSAAPVVTIF